MPELIKCYLQTLAPVHLGCDEVYEPMGFVLDEVNNRLIVYDPWSFFQQMAEADKKKFTNICRKGTINSILEIYKFLQGRQAEGRHVEVCSGLVSHYKKTLKLPENNPKKIQQELNRFSISRTAFLVEDGRPYIPGSAVKGAFRTAYLNYVNKKKLLPKWKGNSRDFEKALLDDGAFETDPFRLFKVSDFMPVGEVKTRILYAVNEKKKPSKFQARGPYQILEVIQPGSVFVGALSLEAPLRGAGIKNPITYDKLYEAAAAFYDSEKKREEEDLFELGLKNIEVQKSSPDFLVRLGRHSGAECLTIDGHRRIRIMQGQGQPAKTLEHATTFWLAADEDKPANKSHLQPFGWVAWRELTSDIEKKLIDSEEKWRQRSKLSGPAAATTKPTTPEITPAPKAKTQEIWETATLTWDKSRQELNASWQGKKAMAKGLELSSEKCQKDLFGKKRMAMVRVIVEHIGGKNYRLVKVED